MLSNQPELDATREQCRTDVWSFATGFVQTEDPQDEAGIRDFPTWDYLKHILLSWVKHRKVAVPKSRQVLISWCIAVFSVWVAGFNKHRRAMIQSQKEEKAKELIDRVRFIVMNLPPWLLPSVPKFTKSMVEFTFPDGSVSKIWAVPQGPDQAATYNPTIYFGDETALQESAEAAHRYAAPCLRKGKEILVSTPRGRNFFWRVCHKMKGFHIERVHYSMSPEHSESIEKLGWEAWKRKMMADLEITEQEWQQEMEINFDVEFGKPVFKPPFNEEDHVTPLIWNPAQPVYRGWDFGFRHPAIVFCQVNPVTQQFIILKSWTGWDQTLWSFAEDVVKQSETIAPFAEFRDFCDPSGINKRDDGGCSVDVLHALGIYPESLGKKVPVRDSIELIQLALEIRPDMRPGMLFDPSNADLIRAMNGGFVTAEDTTQKYAGADSRKIKFKGGNTTHVVDGLRYAVWQTLRFEPWMQKEPVAA